MRFIELCFMKLVMIKQFDETNDLMKMILNLHVNKKFDDFVQRQHNHILNFFDDVKINSTIKTTTDQKMTKKYISTTINKNMQNIK